MEELYIHRLDKHDTTLQAHRPHAVPLGSEPLGDLAMSIYLIYEVCCSHLLSPIYRISVFPSILALPSIHRYYHPTDHTNHHISAYPFPVVPFPYPLPLVSQSPPPQLLGQLHVPA